LLSLVLALVGHVSTSHGETLSDLFVKARITPLPRPVKAHDVVLPGLNGNQFRLKDLRGRIVLLNVWAIWCAPCRQEMPSMERLHRHFDEQDLTVLAVSVDLADTDTVKAFVDEQGYTFSVLHDPHGKIMDWYRVRLIPVTFVIDRSGRVIGKAVGIRDWSEPSMIQLFDELLK
jgi:peroxiredoxin